MPVTPATEVGCPGTVNGITAPEATEYPPVPTLFFAATWKTYDVPFVRPVTTADVALLTESVNVVQLEPLFEEN
jgi:hypothetical protein